MHNRGCGKDYFPDEGTPNSTSIRYDSKGDIYAVQTYGPDGLKTARIDFQGARHYIKGVGTKVIPHVHPFINNNGYLNEVRAITLEEYLRRQQKI